MMKYIKIVLVITLVGFIGSCSLFLPKTTYYYVVSSGCSYHGDISYATPNGNSAYYPSIPLTYYKTVAFRFEPGETVGVAAGITGESYLCWDKNINVTIMKGDTAEGSIGNGGEVWRSANGIAAAFVYDNAD